MHILGHIDAILSSPRLPIVSDATWSALYHLHTTSASKTRRQILYRHIAITASLFFSLKAIGMPTLLSYYMSDPKNMQEVLQRLRNSEIASARADRLHAAQVLTSTVMRATQISLPPYSDDFEAPDVE